MRLFARYRNEYLLLLSRRPGLVSSFRLFRGGPASRLVDPRHRPLYFARQRAIERFELVDGSSNASGVMIAVAGRGFTISALRAHSSRLAP